MDYREQNDFEVQLPDSSYPPILKRRMKKCHKLPSFNYISPPSVYTQLHPKQTAPRSQTLPKHIGFPSAITVA